MKIVLINGQNHKGSSYHIGRMLAEQFPEGKISEFFLPKDLEHFCTGCYACIKNKENCPFYRMSHKPRRCMFSKKAVVISTAAGAGMKSAAKDIQNTLFYWGVPYIKEYGIAVQAMSWDQVSEQKKDRIKQDIKKLANKISNHQNPHAGIKTRFMFDIMRMMQNRGLGSSPEEKEYWKTNGWLDRKRPWNKGGK